MARHASGLLGAGARVYTHCNTGALATGGYGSALGAIRAAWEDGLVAHVWAGETRPLLQGGRLTAWELEQLGIPFSVVADSAAAAAAIAESASAFSRALERGDAAGMASQYVDDATLIPPSGRLVTGRDAILAFWTPRNPDFRTLEHSLTTDRLVITGDVAMEVGTWRQQGQLREEAPIESAGRYLVVSDDAGGFTIWTRSSRGWIPCHSLRDVFPGTGRLQSNPSGRTGTRP